MDLAELKEKVLKNELTFNVLIFSYADRFNVNSYIDTIANNKQANKVIISSLDEYQTDDVFAEDIDEDDSIYVLFADEFDTLINIEDYKNLIIATPKLSSVVSKELKDIVVNFPKLLEWQIKDYMRVKATGLKQEQLDFIYTICNGDIFRIDNELAKLCLFDNDAQKYIFEQLVESNNFEDTNSKAMFNLISAISKKDYKTISYILKNKKSLDLDVFGLVALLKKNFKNVIDIQLNPKATPDSLKMKYNQFMAIKYNCGKYSNKSLMTIYKYLNDFDYELKSGKLDIDDYYLFDYVVCKILTL